MPTQKQLAAALNLSVSRVRQLIGDGMPSSSVDAAIAWRDSKPQERVRGREGNIEIETDDDDAPVDMVGRARQAERAAWQLLSAAIKAGDAKSIHIYTRTHKEAVASVNAAVRADLDEREKHRTLVPMAEAKRIVAQKLGEIAQAMDTFPKAWAARLNPSDPAHAESQARLWVESALKQVSVSDGNGGDN